MKKITIALAFAVLSGHLQAQKKEEVNFSDAFQVDSSSWFIIPRMISDENQASYGKGKGFLPYSCYNELFFYDAAANQSKKLFNRLVIISPFFQRQYGYYGEEKRSEPAPNLLPQHIVVLARVDDYNGDHALDSEDPIYLFLTDKKGGQLRQVTPAGMQVVSWIVSADKKMLLVKLMNDKSGNRKFGNGDDQLYYRVDLDPDISKVKCYPVEL